MDSSTSGSQNSSTKETRFYIKKFHIDGIHNLSSLEAEKAIYSSLGPYRTPADIENARARLEKVYRDKGFPAASVQLGQPPFIDGVAYLQVYEGQIGRVRVRGAEYFSPSALKEEMPSLQEGKVVEFKSFSQDYTAANRIPDRVITPTLKLGQKPGLIDVDLEVKDQCPLHGSIEANNLYSWGTDPYRITTALSYSNLWQLGHTIGFNYQTSPEDVGALQVFSGYYMVPVPDVEWLTLMLQGTKQDSQVSIASAGGSNSVGAGDTIGLRGTATLPGNETFYHSLTFGVDYKYSENTTTYGSNVEDPNPKPPITYFPFSIVYAGGNNEKTNQTQFSTALTWGFRGLGSSQETFRSNTNGSGTDDSGNKIHYGDGSFIYLKVDVSHTREIIDDYQAYGRIQGQIANNALVSSEQFSGGGQETARGYFESESTGDNALFGTVELRSASIGSVIDPVIDDFRFYLFADSGLLLLRDVAAEQKSEISLASFGAGARIRIQKHYSGSFALGVPILDTEATQSYTPRATFRLTAEF